MAHRKSSATLTTPLQLQVRRRSACHGRRRLFYIQRSCSCSPCGAVGDTDRTGRSGLWRRSYDDAPLVATTRRSWRRGGVAAATGPWQATETGVHQPAQPQTHLLHFGPHSNASPLAFPRFRGDCRHSGRGAWCHVCLIISRYCPVFLLCPARSPLHSMVSHLEGRSHVLPRQTCRTTPVPPNRREPLGRRPFPPTRRGHARPPRSPPARRPTRKPPRLRRPLRPAGAPAQRPSQRHPAHAQRPTTRRRPHLRTPLARQRLPGRCPPTPRRTPLRLRRRTRRLPHRPAALAPTRQRSRRRQVEGGLRPRRRRRAATAPPLPRHGLAGRTTARRRAARVVPPGSPVHQGSHRGRLVPAPA